MLSIPDVHRCRYAAERDRSERAALPVGRAPVVPARPSAARAGVVPALVCPDAELAAHAPRPPPRLELVPHPQARGVDEHEVPGPQPDVLEDAPRPRGGASRSHGGRSAPAGRARIAHDSLGRGREQVHRRLGGLGERRLRALPGRAELEVGGARLRRRACRRRPAPDSRSGRRRRTSPRRSPRGRRARPRRPRSSELAVDRARPRRPRARRPGSRGSRRDLERRERPSASAARRRRGTARPRPP